LLPRIKKTYPQLRFVLAVDSLYGCGPVFALTQQLGWSLVVTFKEGRTPTLWREFRALLPHCPENCLKRDWADRPAQEFRWVTHLSYEDSEGRTWKLNALDCTETCHRTSSFAVNSDSSFAANGDIEFCPWLR